MANPQAKASATGLTNLVERFLGVRGTTTRLVEPLEVEDFGVQSMADASPTKWHLAHTTWFFETFILQSAEKDFAPFHPQFKVLFNSYYESVGDKHHRPHRGLLTRPTLSEVRRYRENVEERMLAVLSAGPVSAELAELIELGLHHEQQHQELILTDIKHAFACNPLQPTYKAYGPHAPSKECVELRWHAHEGGVVEIGHRGDGFSFDNEGPRHRVYLEPFSLASRLATNGEFIDFIEDGGYQRPELWLSDGWAKIQQTGWTTPDYWSRSEDGRWRLLTLSGTHPVDPHAPVCHVSYYEADAFARWAGARLPSEHEWELLAPKSRESANMLESGAYHPRALTTGAQSDQGPSQMFGDVWEWTRSPYAPFPGYKAPPGPVGEYNGKFMCDQLVLRGGSCVTPGEHIRATYRNFFPANARWQFSGLRLARDAE